MKVFPHTHFASFFRFMAAYLSLDYAFRGCSSLTSITIPDGVTDVGNYVFCLCSSVTSVTIPDAVTSIGEGAFYKCDSSTDVYYSGT